MSTFFSHGVCTVVYRRAIITFVCALSCKAVGFHDPPPLDRTGDIPATVLTIMLCPLRRYGDKDVKPSVSTATVTVVASDSQNSSPGPMQDVTYPSTSAMDMQDVLSTSAGGCGSNGGISGNTIVMIDDDMPSMSLLVAGDGASAQNVDDLLLPDFDFQYIDGLDSDMSQSFQQYCPTSQGFVSFIATEVSLRHDPALR